MCNLAFAVITAIPSNPARARVLACSRGKATIYQKRIVGSVLERIDIYIEVPRLDYDQLYERRLGETSAAIRQQVEKARQTQRQRFAEEKLAECKVSPVPFNADIAPALSTTGRGAQIL